MDTYELREKYEKAYAYYVEMYEKAQEREPRAYWLGKMALASAILTDIINLQCEE